MHTSHFNTTIQYKWYIIDRIATAIATTTQSYCCHIHVTYNECSMRVKVHAAIDVPFHLILCMCLLLNDHVITEKGQQVPAVVKKRNNGSLCLTIGLLEHVKLTYICHLS